MKQKVKRFIIPLCILLLHPKVRRAYRKALEGADFSKLQYDESDRYHVLMWEGYDFMGKTFKERVEILKKIHIGKPLPILVMKIPNGKVVSRPVSAPQPQVEVSQPATQSQGVS